MNDFVILTGKY